MGSDLERVRKVVSGLSFEKKYELISQAMKKEDSEEEVKEIVSRFTPLEILHVRSRAFKETTNATSRHILAKTHWIIVKEQQTRDLLPDFSVNFSHYR